MGCTPFSFLGEQVFEAEKSRGTFLNAVANYFSVQLSRH